MRIPACLSIVVLFATLPASALNWNQSDPVSQWRSSLSAAPAAPVAVAARPPAGEGGVAGQFDSFVFSLEWTPAFCEGKPGLPECSSGASGRFDAKNLALHGLWPNVDADSSHSYGYCGVAASVRELDRAATWCRMPAPGVSGGVMSRLSPLMPGTASCLQNHEWYKHGSCSGLSPDEYFTRASDLVEFVARTNFGRFLTAHAGETVTADDALAAFEKDFGAGSRGKVALLCTKAGSVSLLLDVRMNLGKTPRPASELGKMLLPIAGKGNCPASFKLDSF